MTIRMQQRRDSAANWTGSPVILASGEIGVETDTGRIKVGNGSSIWTALPYSTLSEFKTSAAWGSYAPAIALGKICFDSDSPFFKVGDGTSTWSELDYFKPASAILGDVGIDFDTLEEIQDLLLGGTANQVLVTPNPDGTPVWSNTLTDIQSLDFNTAAGTSGLAKIAYDDTLGTLEFGLKGGNVTLHIGQGQVLRVRNNTGSTLAKGTVVYINGSNGTNFNVAKALADSDSTSAQTIGVLAEELNTSSTQHGFAMTYGLVPGVDLSYIAGLANGDMLFLDPSTAGRLTKTKPSGPDHLVYMGYCLSAAGGGSNSTIFVKPQNGYELNEIHDVKVSSLANNDILTYDNTTDPTNPVWVNKNSVDVTGNITSSAGNISATAGSLTSQVLRVTSTTDATTSSTTHAVQVGTEGGLRLVLDSDEIHAYNGSATSNLKINEDGGTVSIASASASATTTINGPLITATGTADIAPLRIPSGTNLTTTTPGAIEYDGSFFYATKETTSGRGNISVNQTYRLTSNGTAFGPAIGDFYGANSSINLAASSVYEIEFFTYFTKTTAGTLTFTLLASSAPTRFAGYYIGSPITGIAATGAPATGNAGSAANGTTAAFAATGSLTTAVEHYYKFNVTVLTNAATNFRLRFTSSAGTVTPLIGSYYTVNRISSTQGSFA